MPTPQLKDDGRVVTLDLHGATVDEALDLTYRTLRLADDRGRSRLRLIHGSSTTQAGATRTIKRALYDELNRGSLGTHATNVIRQRDTLILALDVTAASDPTPIRLRDVQPT
ncbi:MAG: Smr/MutS family protein [Salinivenus sp.]